MSRDRQEPCKFYICANHPCEKGRDADHSGYCGRCSLYIPRARVKHLNIKKEKLKKIRNREWE